MIVAIPNQTHSRIGPDLLDNNSRTANCSTVFVADSLSGDNVTDGWQSQFVVHPGGILGMQAGLEAGVEVSLDITDPSR